MSAVLVVRELRKVYKGRRPYEAVKGISFDLQEGEILGLLGVNGAGKTSTIQMLLSTLKPTSGSIVYFGKDFFTHRSETLKKVAFASTYVSLPWKLTIEQNLKVFALLYSLSDDTLRYADTLLARFGIKDKKHVPLASLSAGQITRVMLVKAFMTRPKVALLDEPTASLDPDMAKDVLQFVLEQRDKNGTAILYTSHNMAEITAVCDRALFMQNGKIIADDMPERLAKSVGICTVTLQVGDGLKRTLSIAKALNLPCKTDHRSIEFELDEENIAMLLSVLAQAGVIYTHIEIRQPTLEDYFLHIAKQVKQ